MPSKRALFLALLFALVASSASQSTLGFVPSLVGTCSSSLSSFISLLEPSNTCGTILNTVVTNVTQFTTCSSGRGGVNCFNPESVLEASEAAKYLVPVYRLPTTLTTCSLCTPSSGMISSCQPLLLAVIDAAYGETIDFSSFGIANQTTIDNVNAAAAVVKTNCGDYAHTSSLQVLRYQSEVLCASQDTFNMTVSSAGNIQGILDMRSLLQCGTCAVLPCWPGQLCDGSGSATMCPEGYYCPTTLAKIKCPSGSFCPQGSTSPVKCSKDSPSSCNKESDRQVVWIPLFISLMFILAILAIPYVTELSALKQQLGQKTSPVKTPGKMFKAVPLQDEMTFSTQSSPVAIDFREVRLVSGKTTRISGVSGRIRPGKFTAIIGGSGAGKTSLMNVILGREARTSGDVAYVSDDVEGKISPSLLPRLVAFVPQNDVYLREMTVYELIMHSAKWRLPSSFTTAMIEDRVEEVLEQLQLQHLRNVQVGSTSAASQSSWKIVSYINDLTKSKSDTKSTTATPPMTYQLSPGDKKKVNIALELVAGPNVLFLDEPTTGIDSSSALNVATIVRNLARTGLTCVAVIHQPRAEIFSLIDDMIILIRGGYVAYQGPTEYVMAYFASFGLKPQNWKANKTDFLIDMVSKPPPAHLMGGDTNASLAMASEAKRDDQTTANAPTAEATAGSGTITWSDLWQKYGEEFLLRAEAEAHPNDLTREPIAAISHIPTSSNSQKSGTRSEALTRRREEASASNKTFVPLDVPRPGFVRQLLLNTVRGLQQHTKNGVYLSDMLVHFLGGVIMGIATCGGPLLIGLIPPLYQGSCPPGAEVRCNIWQRFEVGPATFLISMILGAITIPIAVRTFGREKEVFAREAAVGANPLAYYLGKMLADFPFMALNCFLYMAPIVAIAPWQAPPEMLYAIMLCLALVVLSLGYVLSLVFADPDDAVLTGVIFAILLNLFSGFVPTIGDGPIGQIMYTHWSARAIVAAELMDGQNISEDDFNQIVPDEWKDPDFPTDCGNMVATAVALFVFAFALLAFFNRQGGKLG